MRHVDFRDLGLTILFGVVSPYLWAGLIGVLSAATQLPLLASLSREFGPRIKPWVPTYMFAWEVVGGALCALVIALPLGFLLRRHIWPMWVLFAGLFLASLAISALLTEEPSIFFFVLTFPAPWVFLLWSALFVLVGHRLKMRRHVALYIGN